MSNIRDITLKTSLAASKARSQNAQQKHLPSPVWNTMIWKEWTGYSRWEKKKIIEQGYERNAPFYAAANIIAQTIADIPIYVEYEKRGQTDHTTSHPILKTLERNSTREELMESLVLYFVVTGEAYGHIVFSSTGAKKRPLGIIPIPSQYVTPKSGDQYAPISHYEVQNYSKVDLQPHEVIHVLKPDLSHPFKGMSPGVPLAELIDLNNAGITWNKNVALSGGTPPIIATAPGNMSKEEAKAVQEGYTKQSGAKNSHVLKILSGELDIHDLNTDPHDAEWGNAVLMSMRMILMSLGVSSSLMNDAANKTYNNVKDSRKALYLDACLPIAERIYKKISRSLRAHYDDNPLIKPDRSSIEALQEDQKAQAERLSELKLSGIISANEARSVLKWPKSSEANADLLETAKQPSAAEAPKPDEPVNANNE